MMTIDDFFLFPERTKAIWNVHSLLDFRKGKDRREHRLNGQIDLREGQKVRE